jgi:hypothetical protein
VCDKCAKGRKCMEGDVGAAGEAITGCPRKSVRRLAQQIGFSANATWGICRDYLSLFPYKM